MPRMDKIDGLLNQICQNAARLLNASASSIFLKEGDSFRMRAAHGDCKHLIYEAIYKPGEGITGWIAQGNDFVANNNDQLTSDPHWKGKYDWVETERPCRGLVGLPLKSGNEIIGLIKVENKKDNIFTQGDVDLLKIFAETASEAIETNQQLMREIKGKLYVFVLMPFKGFDDFYEFAIRQSVNRLEHYCERVDERHFTGRISTEIYKCIERANYIIADMTGKNPNVFYEVGYAHALRKEVILLAQDKEDIPFDLQDVNHILYHGNIRSLAKAIEERLGALIAGDRQRFGGVAV
jgi:hypothetical protein